MLEYEFIVHKFVLNVWDKAMIKEILTDSSINRFLQEADLSNTGVRHATPNH